MAKERIRSFDFVRAACTLGIVLNHFAIESHSEGLQRYLYEFPSGGGSLGYTLVTVFFLISGCLLYLNHREVPDVSAFYAKRWLSIYPSFYLAYLPALALYRLTNPSFFSDRRLHQLVFTLIGFDGYLAGRFRTWYILGEWFLGAIIICYLVYPLLSKAIERSETGTLVVVSALFLMTMRWNMLGQHAFRNPFSCVFSFLVGMLICRHRLYESRPLALGGLAVFLLFYVCPLSVPENIEYHVCGIALFFALNALGGHAMRSSWMAKAIDQVARLSYEVFLVHHLTIIALVRIVAPTGPAGILATLVASVALSLVGAYVLSGISRSVVKRIRSTQRTA